MLAEKTHCPICQCELTRIGYPTARFRGSKYCPNVLARDFRTKESHNHYDVTINIDDNAIHERFILHDKAIMMSHKYEPSSLNFSQIFYEVKDEIHDII